MAKHVGVQRRGPRSFRIHYTDDYGVRHYETVNGTLEEAVSTRQVRLGDIARGLPVSSKPNTILFEELAADVLTDYKLNNFSSFSDQEARFRLHILPAFGKRKAAQISSSMLKAYALQRLEQGAKQATVNRELELMRHAYKLGSACTPPKVLFMPKFHIPKERNARKGFFEREQIDAIAKHLPAHLIPVVFFGYFTGWRHDEVVTLCWRHIHFGAREVRLEPNETKNGEGRTFPMIDELYAILEKIKPKTPIPGNRIFTRAGAPIGRFDKAWTTACKKAGLPVRYVEKRVLVDGAKQVKIYKRGKRKGQPILVARAAVYFHDFRRTAYRNLVRKGIPETVAMAAVGWTDRDTADRYNITAKADLELIREAFDGPRANLRAKSTKSGQ